MAENDLTNKPQRASVDAPGRTVRQFRRVVGVAAVALVCGGCGSSASTVAHTTATIRSEPPKKLTPKEVVEARADAKRKEKEEAQSFVREHETSKSAEAAQAKEASEAEATRAREAREELAGKAKEEATANAKKLVEIWKEEPVEAGDGNVGAIASHLVSLGAKCQQSIHTLAGEINSAVEILKKESINETPPTIAAAYDRAVPPGRGKAECRGILSALLVLIEQR